MHSLELKIAQEAKDAPNYNELNKLGEKWNAANLKSAVIVKNGTEGGLPTVDLIFEDEDGNKFVAMTTARLLRSVVTASGIGEYE